MATAAREIESNKITAKQLSHIFLNETIQWAHVHSYIYTHNTPSNGEYSSRIWV